MKTVRFKQGVLIAHLKPEMLHCLDVVGDFFDEKHLQLVITSTTDGMHSSYSHHYKGLALDIRTWNIPDDRVIFVRDLQSALGKNYQVIDEGTHIHIEYDPKDNPHA